MKAITTVAFDIDGTLYPNHRMYTLSFPLALSNFNLLRSFHSIRLDLRKYENIHNFHDLQNSLMAARLQMPEDIMREIIEKTFYQGWENIFTRVKIYSGLIETLKWLKHKGITIAALSDFPVEGKLKHLGIREYFTVALCSEDSGQLKPGSAAFSMLLDRVQADAEECLFVGNSYSYDIIGAHKLGMRTAHRALYKRIGSPADITFNNYNKFLKWLKTVIV